VSGTGKRWRKSEREACEGVVWGRRVGKGGKRRDASSFARRVGERRRGGWMK
jgi:hypothetical protein